jgi:hypothetical protein
MVIDQRNAGASLTHSGGSNFYGMDRMVFNSNGTPQFSVQRVEDAPPGFTFSAKLTTTTAGTPAATDFSYFGQYIEGFNVADFAFGTASATTVTISFWVKSSLTGTFGGAIRNGSNNRSYPFSFSINVVNTWEFKTVTVPGDVTGVWGKDNSYGLTLVFDTGSGANNKGTAGAWNSTANIGVTGGTNLVATAGATINITGLQLEKGSTATSFDYRPFGAELVLCERYFEKSFNYETAPAHNTGGLPVVPVGSNLGCGGNAYWIIPLKTCKRINNYTVRWYDPLGAHPASENWVRYITACDTGTAAGPNSNMVINSLTTNHIAGHSQVGTAVPPIIYWTADAEL